MEQFEQFQESSRSGRRTRIVSTARLGASQANLGASAKAQARKTGASAEVSLPRLSLAEHVVDGRGGGASEG